MVGGSSSTECGLPVLGRLATGTGRNLGSAISSVTRSKATSTGRSNWRSAGAVSSMRLIRRTPSSISMTTTAYGVSSSKSGWSERSTTVQENRVPRPVDRSHVQSKDPHSAHISRGT